ncbi:MAG: TolC family protein [Algoriphagus sp.]|jgi:outer membrane protein TolC|uniref:TolC family protein n=1 Tax=Algoriphagus sp. TaxID=1872435 RepID=UPI00271977F8|nr:TolC family protein [Algoriphagus sp.]MDO8968066.1 TolC family protein [Algoriphagus sp.]MDP2041656.1 TolC family protein [Algoriphagus sp.]MDP3202167.1 TolC family protein [Algoriphagus sp.]MDP3473213.1 TolC family protein [Algoriphagus sp.]
MKKLTLILLVIFWPLFAKAQDTLKLKFEEYMEWVRLYHPVSSQAELNLRFGQMELMQARGAFDPLIYGNLDKKQFKESTYYDKREAGISIPTWMGVELNGVFEQNSGNFLNPEAAVPSNGLLAAGASVNLGQGLILDQRRASLRQAQIFQQSSEVERVRLLNELNLAATAMYWKWALAYENLNVLREGVELAASRFNYVKRSFEQGDFAAIDTVEAFSQLLNRQYRLQETENSFFATTQELNTFLWNEDGNPMTLGAGIVPESLFEEFTSYPDFEELRTLVINHPELLITDFELASLDVERRLKGQEMLPTVKLKYNFLSETLSQFDESPFYENNYKWGLSVYTPLLWRKSRGAFGLAKAKIDFKQNSRDLKEIQLRMKLEAELNNWRTLNLQLLTFTENVKSLQALLTGEIRRFQMGESSLFLVNAREVSVFDSRVTLNDLASKLRISYAKTRYAAGIGFD